MTRTAANNIGQLPSEFRHALVGAPAQAASGAAEASPHRLLSGATGVPTMAWIGLMAM